MFILAIIGIIVIACFILYAISLLVDKGTMFSAIEKKQNNKRIIMLIVSIVVLLASMVVANYYFLIRLNFRYLGIFIYITLFGLLVYNMYGKYENHSTEKKMKINVLSIIGVITFCLLYAIFGGRPIFFADDYANLIEVSEADFVQDIQTVNIENLPLVDKAYGSKLGSLKLGEYPGIGSEFEVGAYSDIIYQGRQHLVAPLEYRGFFKWLNNKSIGTPGYILIDKVTAETQFINLREETGEGLVYTPSAYLNQDLIRHTYFNGLQQYSLENYFFEIDEAGTPYYILQYSLPTIFINGGKQINKIAVVNALNGNVDVYQMGSEPDWVESVYPNAIIFRQLDFWGKLQDGWLNSAFGQKGVLQTSSGTRIIMNDGELYYFTGLTSAGNDESTIGFVYSGTKTKETKLFRFPGATEDAAMNKVLTLLPQNNISTSFPIPINVNDVPSYFILIKGEDGRILRYIFISVQDLELYSISEVQEDAYDDYLSKLDEDSNYSSAIEVEGTITDITSYVSEGNTIYWIQIDNDLRYKINVSHFTDEEMGYFISLNIGDDITINIINYLVVNIDIE